MTVPYDVIIAGGGPAGLSAGIYCMRSGLRAILFEPAAPGGQVATSKDVDNYPGIEAVTGFDLAEKLLHHARTFNLPIEQKEVEAVSVGTDLHSVRVQDAGSFQAAVLILAFGGTARRLDVPGEAEYFGRGVSYCATCDGFFFRNKTVAVVGGGDNAVEEALHLARLTKKVYLVHRRNELRASRRLQQLARTDPSIEIVWNTQVRSIKGSGGAVTAVALENTETGKNGDLAVDGIFIRIGYSPNNRLIPPEIRINDEGFVVTDEKCQTSVPGIFAAGDLRQKYANQIVVAAADGCIAALAAAHYIEMRKTA